MTRLLDVTRLVSRAGRPLTGVDRVEFAWLDHLLQLDTPVFGLLRTSLGYVLLDRAGCARLHLRIRENSWPAPDRLGRLARKNNPQRAGAETELRDLAVARTLTVGLARMLRKHLPRGVHYVNVGHTNFTRRVIDALDRIDARKAVLVHDTIPLDYPQFQRPGSVDRFAGFLAHVADSADLILCNSQQTQADVTRHIGADHQMLVAPLGVVPPRPTRLPKGSWDSPYFVTLGTIEPRKNHALLLDLWETGNIDADLLIIGGRGWENHDTFARLDAQPSRVHELPNLTDGEIAALMQGAAGFLFPSLAEGYGLPPIEAACLQVPILCNDLNIYGETLGPISVYADVKDVTLWQKTIQAMAQDCRENRKQSYEYAAPSWDAHFEIALTRI
ncbi:glycosyltransferase family 4 protein [Sagittula sp. SSi028]|uniref:glycosyltransferase family 4 protein n=1 Tax=Sagittula sp. SSi028 TaxID=3400636 RepID=UPI003AF83B17